MRYPEGADVETVREAVGAAVEAVRGGAGISYSRDDGSRICTGTWTSANTALDVVVTAATRAFASLRAPGWAVVQNPGPVEFAKPHGRVTRVVRTEG